MNDTRDAQLPLAGQCRCGRIRYHVSQPPKFVFACHCTDCQQFSSSAFSLGMAVAETAFTMEGDPRCWEKTGESGGWSRQFTCSNCAGWTHTIANAAKGMVIVRPSTLQNHGWVRPVAQIYTRSALPWALLPVAFSFAEEFEDPAPLGRAFKDTNIFPST